MRKRGAPTRRDWLATVCTSGNKWIHIRSTACLTEWCFDISEVYVEQYREKQRLKIHLCVSVVSYVEGKIILLVSKTLDERLIRKKAKFNIQRLCSFKTRSNNVTLDILFCPKII